MERKTLSKIDQILARIRLHPEYSSAVTRKSLEHMREEASRHSAALEAESGEFSTTRDIEKFKAEAYKNLIKAKDFLRNEQRCEGGLRTYSLSCLGNLLEPEINRVRGFRQSSINFGEFEGEPWANIPHKINELIEITKDSAFHPVTRAINAHATIINVHPYKDSNGRAARLFQDFLLEGMSYPAGIIPVTDRALYISLMNGLIRDRRNLGSSIYEPSEKESLFYDFIESKVLASSERLEGELKERRAYNVGFRGLGSPGVVMKVKHKLTGSNGRKLEVHKENSKSSKFVNFSVIGNVSLEELEERVSFLAQKYGVRYSISLRIEEGHLNYYQLGKLNEEAQASFKKCPSNSF